jgi:hypothetical protein
MKRCAWCGREYPDAAMECSLDQQPLESVDSASEPLASAGSQSSASWQRQVAIPAVAWLIVNFVLIGRFTVAASFLLNLLLAIWAAMDCAKLQSRGTRALGIVFKPVVVLAVVPFFLGGFGFVWYLVMRYRVKTAPIELEGAVEKTA